jgi:hypothetical protein
MEKVLIISHSVALFIGLGVIFYRTVLNGKFGKGLFSIWLFLIVFFFLISVIIPGFLAPYNKDLAVHAFPEAICMMPIIFFGWMPSFVISVVAILVRELILRFKPSLLDKKETKEQSTDA